MSTQLPLNFRFPARMRFEHFLPGENQLALASVLALLPVASEFQGVMLSGPEGCGKSHLAQAAAQSGEQALYLPLRELGQNSLAALDACPEQGLIVIDDVQAIAGRRRDEIALFDLFNRLKSAGARLLVTSNELPNRLPLHLPDLISRLGSLNQQRLKPLAEFEVRAVMVDRARARGLTLSGEVLDFLLRRYPRNLGALLAIVDHLDQASLAAQRRITVPFIRRVIDGGKA